MAGPRVLFVVAEMLHARNQPHQMIHRSNDHFAFVP